MTQAIDKTELALTVAETATEPNTEALARDITKLSLRELCLEASKLWSQLEEASDSEGAVEEIIQQLFSVQEAIPRKIDGIVWVAEGLQVEIEDWKCKKDRISEMYDKVIARKVRQLEEIKQGILKLNEVGLLPDLNLGEERAFEIQDNPPKVVPTVDPSLEEFPDEYKVEKIKYEADKKKILDAHKEGVDVSGFAEVTVGKHVRFKMNPERTRKTKAKTK
ncbi:siphovirus Gp157 family protein [Scytonema hofmannii]|nr:siphovirus Gp157 family protein [Scytonema hofmannii]